jgi:hypothetical protein
MAALPTPWPDAPAPRDLRVVPDTDRPEWARAIVRHREDLGLSVKAAARSTALHPSKLHWLEEQEVVPPSRAILGGIALGYGLDDDDTGRLLVLAGYLPDDATLRTVVTVLYGDLLPAEHVERFREQVAAVGRRYGIAGVVAYPGVPSGALRAAGAGR